MNIAPILRSLRQEDFDKVIAACKTRREAFPYILARNDNEADFHIVVPDEERKPMDDWLQDEEKFT
jgi:hypothetical protein